jgi:hypothetical protein
MTTNLPEIMALYGWALQGVPLGAKSHVYLVDPANGSDSNSGLHPDAALASVEEAEDRCVGNQHDVVVYIAGASSITLSDTLTWDKNYTHFVGICAPSHVGQRARLFLVAGNNDINPMIDWQATGCVVKNIYAFHGVADADSLICWRVSGSRNKFENVHFAGGGDATMAIDGGASLNLYQAASENTFEDCTIGVDTIASATGMVGLLFSGQTGDIHATRNLFRNCRFRMKAGAAGAAFVETSTIYALDRDTLMENCQFINLAAQAMTSAFVIKAGSDPNDKRFLLDEKCRMIGAGEWDSGDSGLVYLAAGTLTAGGNSGIWQATNST